MAKKINILLIHLEKKVLRCEDTIALGLSNVDQGSNDDEHAKNAVSWLISEDLVEDFKRDTGDIGQSDINARALRDSEELKTAGNGRNAGKKRKDLEEDDGKAGDTTAASTVGGTDLEALVSSTQGQGWNCHKCDTINLLSRKRCKGCLGWKGGVRNVGRSDDYRFDDGSMKASSGYSMKPSAAAEEDGEWLPEPKKKATRGRADKA